MGGKNCKFGDVKCLLQGTPLGPAAKALDKPWQVATTVAAQALKGTPLEQTTAAFAQAAHGDVKGSISKQLGGVIDIVKAYVPAVGSVPGIGLATDFAKTLVDNSVNPKKAGGAALNVNIPIPAPGQLAAMVGPNSPIAALLQPTTPVSQPVPPRVAPTPPKLEVQAIVASTTMTGPPPPPTARPAPGGRFKPSRVFTRAEWISHVNDPRTMGGLFTGNVP